MILNFPQTIKTFLLRWKEVRTSLTKERTAVGVLDTVMGKTKRHKKLASQGFSSFKSVLQKYSVLKWYEEHRISEAVVQLLIAVQSHWAVMTMANRKPCNTCLSNSNWQEMALTLKQTMTKDREIYLFITTELLNVFVDWNFHTTAFQWEYTILNCTTTIQNNGLLWPLYTLLSVFS